MPDLLAHALLAYAGLRALSWRVAWVRAPWITVGMAGAFVPDLTKVRLVVESRLVEAVLGVPFDWRALHTAGGSAVAVGVGVLLVAPEYRRRAGALLAAGAGSHLLLDALLATPSGRSYPLLWPLTWYAPPTPGLYLSTRPGPTVVAAALAGAVFAADRWRRREGGGIGIDAERDGGAGTGTDAEREG